MHIVYVSREYPPTKRMGGIAAYLKIVAEEFVKQGNKVTVIASNDDTRFRREEIINGVKVIRLSGGDFFIKGAEPKYSKFKNFRCIYRFGRFRKKIKKEIQRIPDLDIIEVAEYGAEYIYLLKLNIPLTVRLHTSTLLDRRTGKVKKFKFSRFHEFLLGKIEINLLSKAPFVNSCCLSLLEWTQNFYNLKATNPEVIYNPINIDAWSFNSDFEYQENSILFAGTITNEKGVGDLLTACSILRNSGLPIKLSLAGKISSSGLLVKKRVIDQKLDWCTFLGQVSQQELQKLYASHKISCFPSWWEACGMVCLESMASGNITLTSNIGGFSEIITDGKDGFFVEPKNPEALAKKLKEVLCLSKKEIEIIKINALNTLRTNFSLEQITKKLENHYKYVITNWK